MMRRSLALALPLVLALLIPATAAAKGPSEATITGPGLSSPIKFSGVEGNYSQAFGDLIEQGGFFPQTFGQSPDPLKRSRPSTSLGPRYEVAYVVPGPTTDTLRQELYPYASGGSVTYMKPGQTFWGNQRTHGGWLRAGAGLKSTLVAAGLPPTAPEAPAAPASRHGSSSGRTAMMLGGGLGFVLALGALLLYRRRK
jgi:hypothetical protein